MIASISFHRLAVSLGALLLLAAAPPSPTPLPETRVRVTLPAGWTGDASGRLLVFAEPATADNAKDSEIDSAAFRPKPVSVAARDVASFGQDRAVLIDTQEIAYPNGFASLAPGDYRVQAVLDRNGNYNYDGRGPGDLVSKVVTLHWPAQGPATVALDHEIADAKPERSKAAQALVDAAQPHLHEEMFQSRSLTAFWGKPETIGVWVLTPPDYDPKAKATWPTVYHTGGFGTSHGYDVGAAAKIWDLEAKKQIPPMIWVFLDHSSLGTGTTEFADSVNNGPWGHALTTELIPALERQYRMDARVSGRFLTGHSSGGWAALWMQVAYPKMFGGSWPTAPDPSTFHDFTGADLYAPNANFYHDAADQPHWLIRDHEKKIATIEQFARLEAVLGRDGGQFRSFEWVFSPKGPDGGPEPMFDRATGQVDPAVVAYWRDHYDVVYILQRDWKTLKPDLDGKIHLTVGTADTFFLDGAAHKLEAVMRGLGARTDFTYVPNKTHMDLYERDGDKQALTKDIAKAMYAVARP
jgi:enterochelin esterase-like enzyme